ncbi:MAG: TatD family hydrolase [Oligoflexia bacterium]|nr:TatD family hydrolase [Oligoflexia bacterium]
MWIDAHTHLEMLEDKTDEVLTLAKASGVDRMITIGCHPNDFAKVCAISKAHYPIVAATLGVHPHDAKFYTEQIENEIRETAKEIFIIGVGEIGLDYFYNHSEQDIQRTVFNQQMTLANELKLPVQIHSRDAEDDTIEELNKWNGKVTGMMHCFSGTEKLARAALDVGFYISLSGVITFKNAHSLREIVKNVPLGRLLIETDAPFLAPVPMRGRKNTPAFVSHTAAKVAEIKGISLEELSAALLNNVKTLFPKWRFNLEA